MNKEISRYITEFKTVYNGEPWYGRSLAAILGDVDPAAVFTKPNPGTHSIFEIVHHMYAWRDLLVKRLQGDTKSKISMNSPEDWSPAPNASPEEAWKELIQKLDQNQQALVPALAQWKDEALYLPFAGTEYPLRTFLDGHFQHDIYHIGQVALAMKSFK